MSREIAEARAQDDADAGPRFALATDGGDRRFNLLDRGMLRAQRLAS
jgi:hypothetical protein